MKTSAPSLLLALLWGTTSAIAQVSPGVSAKPTGQTLEDPRPDPSEMPVDLSRPDPEPTSITLTAEEEIFFEPAQRGEAWAQTKLGKLYITAGGDEARLQQGIDLLRRAAEGNDAEALFLLSSLAASGTGLPQSDLDAFDQCLKAANLGLVEAQYRLAAMYAAGRGTTQDTDLAMNWFRKAALEGHAPAKHALALALLRSQEPGESSAEAIGWLESAAKDGHREATFFLAGATANGDYGLAKDEKKAAEMALPRAEAGDAEFQFALATLFLKGETFADRRADGRKWLEQAAASGHAGAQQMLEEQNSPAH